METYVSLVKGKGKQGICAVKKTMEAAGCKQIASYVLMGQYDVLIIFEAPDAVTAAAAIWEANQAVSEGESQTQTMRAFTEKELEKLQQLIGRT